VEDSVEKDTIKEESKEEDIQAPEGPPMLGKKKSSYKGVNLMPKNCSVKRTNSVRL